nr:tetratricopeptide repeat protein [Prevotella sp.]
MKKFIIAAMMLLGTSAAFAGDSEPLKAILANKDFAGAQSALKANLASLTSNSEKAKAYNYLVDLAMKQYDAQASVELENNTMKQMGQKGDKPVDKPSMYVGAYNALINAVECNKYDQMPNEKGKVKPRFESENSQRIWNARTQLVNAGQDASKEGKDAEVLKYWGTFVDTDNDPLFATVDQKNRDNEKAYFGQVARFAGVYAYQAKDYAKADKYADIAMKTESEYKDALTLKLGVAQAQLKNHTDSVAFVKTVKDLYTKDSKNETLFGTLVNVYSQMNMKTELDALLDAKEKEDPKNFVVFAVRGQNAMVASDLDKAIPNFKKALEIQPDNAQILAYLGACLFDKAQKAEERASGNTGRVPQTAKQQIEPVFKEAMSTLEKARQLDPDHSKSNWPYPLYRVYYRLLGPNDAKTVEAQGIAGVN